MNLNGLAQLKMLSLMAKLMTIAVFLISQNMNILGAHRLVLIMY
jgi:hypothetical protein